MDGLLKRQKVEIDDLDKVITSYRNDNAERKTKRYLQDKKKYDS